MNRQQRREEQRSAGEGDGTGDAGATADPPAAFAGGGTDVSERLSRVAVPVSAPRRTNPRQFLHEVNVEMRKVAWPTRAETINYSSVVLVTLVVLMALIFALDLGFSKVSLYLFK
jgi:preprotein translocase subunit SecE